jgi:hypothetical protein
MKANREEVILVKDAKEITASFFRIALVEFSEAGLKLNSIVGCGMELDAHDRELINVDTALPIAVAACPVNYMRL